MLSLQNLINKASTSPGYRWLLNRALDWSIPFNAPHHFTIREIRNGYADILLPYRRANRNHVNGIHACALATLCEFTSGLALITRISAKDYRIILKNLDMEYHYQAKTDVHATFGLTEQIAQETILNALQNADAVFVKFTVNVYDAAENHICTAKVNWQVKKWSHVKS